MARRARSGMLIACALLAVSCTGSAGPPERIVLVVVDTLRRDALPMFGGEARTPHMAGLAARGTAHAALASFHQTTMSMGALFTGRTPSLETGDASEPLAWLPTASCGMSRFVSVPREGVCLPPEVPTLGEAIRARGYHTLGVVANPLLFDPAGFSRGFDRWEEVGGAKTRKLSLAAERRAWPKLNQAVRAVLADLPQAPLFLYVHYLDVHDWLYRDMSYTESVEEMDRGIGELLAILGERGLLEDAAIVLTSDHGELIDAEHVVKSLPLHSGNPAYRDVLDVPLLLVGADAVEIPDFVRSEDLHHLLLALADAPPSQVRDLAADELFLTELTYQTYQSGRFKSLQRRDGELWLLDLEADPGETRDVAETHPEVVQAHRRRVAQLTRELAARSRARGPTRPSKEWLDRLRVLGYVQ